MITEADIFDYEGALSEALAEVFRNVELNTLTIRSTPTFQKDRARVEAFVKMNGSKGLLWVDADHGSRPGETFELLHNGTAELSVITQADDAIHRAYKSRIRKLCATILTAVNPGLTYHELQRFSDSGSGLLEHDETNGNYRTVLNYDFDIAIIPQALTDFLNQ